MAKIMDLPEQIWKINAKNLSSVLSALGFNRSFERLEIIKLKHYKVFKGIELLGRHVIKTRRTMSFLTAIQNT